MVSYCTAFKALIIAKGTQKEIRRPRSLPFVMPDGDFNGLEDQMRLFTEAGGLEFLVTSMTSKDNI